MAKKGNFNWIIWAIVAVFVVLIVIAARGSVDNSTNNLGKVKTNDKSKGAIAASVTLIEYADFQCPACASYHPVIKSIEEKYGDRLKIVFRHLPLTSIHPNAFPAAKAAEAADKQDKFWEMHDLLFENQNEWSGISRNVEAKFEEYAEKLGLNLDQYRSDYESDEVEKVVREDLNSANALGLNSTPSFLLNEEKIQNPRSLEAFEELIEAKLGNAPVPEISKDDLANAPDTHEHADFAVYLNGKKIDFTLDKYQSDEVDENGEHDHSAHTHDAYSHLHNNDGHIIHKHKEGITLGYFFKTLGMEFTDECFKTDDGEEFCKDENNSLKFFVNGSRNTQNGSYVFSDLDQILISYGPLTDNNLQKQLNSLTDEACIYSEKCPERGATPEEQCVGGLGTSCTQ